MTLARQSGSNKTGQPLLPLKVRAFLDFATPRLKARLL
jgi:hypothetical protein